MATKTCFKCCCRIWADAFPSNIDGVTVVAGTAAHATDHLALTAAGTLVVSNTTDTGAAYFLSVLRCGDSNEVFWVLVDYLDDENYHALKIEFRYSGDTSRIQLYKVTAGTPTALGSALDTLTHFAEDDAIVVQLCLTNAGHFIAALGDGGISVAAFTTRHSGGNKVGWLLETATTLEVDNVDWQTEKSDRATCPECPQFCSGCRGEFELTITGAADAGACNNCNELLNRSFVVPPLCGCLWLLELGEPDGCGDAANETTFDVCDGDDATITRPFLYITTFVGGGVTAINAHYFDASGGIAQWTFVAIESPDPDCEVLYSRTPLSISSNTTACDLTGSEASTVFNATA